ncbi:SDR family oxidoreductase [Dyadobacter bucti]|uniref:SDR family oxidoreductase n=1 Tax=Dyadobacter bucti TaxID=2572203 RepID=UPI001108BD7E|nr:SDR family oxidoreductase [Dyadobacter bucti]
MTEKLLARAGVIPLGRMADPAKIAELMLFLVSKVSYITGHNLVADGGNFPVL